MGGIFSVVARMKHMLTPGTAPPAGTSMLYFKSDGLPYCMDPSGTERPLIDIPSSLHDNPTFDAVTSGKPSSWSDFWMSGGATLATDSVDRVAGNSAAVVFPGGAANGRMQETNAHGINDLQVITFGFWAKSTTAQNIVITHVTNTTSAGAQHFSSGAVVDPKTVAITTSYAKYQVSWTVPAGHLYGRFDVTPAGGSPAATLHYDESFSSATTSTPATSMVPVASVLPYALATAPAGYLLCDNTVRNIADYPILGGLLGSTYGGDGVTTFGVPDLRGRFPLGAGTLAGSGTAKVRGDSGGFDQHTLVVGQIPGHTHTIAHTHNAGTLSVSGRTTGPGSQANVHTQASGSGAITEAGANGATAGVNTGSSGTGTGGGAAHPTLNPYMTVNYIIKT